MRFTLAFVSLIAAVIADSKPNSFNIPSTGNYLLTAGQPTTFTWSDPTPGTVTLLLRTGANSDLKTVATIASSISNTGSYTYTPPADTPEGANYAVEIVSDSDPSVTNYTPQFVIKSNVQAVATSGGPTSLVTATSAGSSASGSSATAATTSGASTGSSASATGSSSASQTASSSGSSSSGASSSATGSSSAKSSGSMTASSGPSVPSTGAAAQGVKAASGLLAVAVGFAIAM